MNMRKTNYPKRRLTQLVLNLSSFGNAYQCVCYADASNGHNIGLFQLHISAFEPAACINSRPPSHGE